MSDELMELPEGWEWATPETLSTFEDNSICAGPFGTIFKAKDFRDSGIPIIFLRHVGEGRYLTHKPGFMDVQKWKELFKPYSVYGGELLVTKLGEPPGVCTIYPEGLGPAMVTPDVIKMTVNKEAADSKYLMYYFNSEGARRSAFGIAYGVTRLRMNLPIFRNLSVPLAPLNEQKRIVAAIESLRERSQKARSALAAIPELCDKFRQSVLAAAFRGDLTADWREQNPDVEPASVLLERIRRDRRKHWEELELEKFKTKGEIPKNAKWKDRYQAPLQIDQAHFPVLPEGWCWISVEELVSDLPRSIQSGPFGSSLLHSEFQDAGVLAIGIDNVQNGYFTLGNENRISIEKYKELEKYTARSLDVLITVMATVGRCCVVPPDIETAIITKHVYRLSPGQELINSYFLMNALRGSEECLRQMYGHIRGQTRPGINGQILRALAIPVPPKLEQEQILIAIQTQFETIIRVSDTLNRLDMNMSLLDRSILAKAFRGELVEQDTDDEPASVLLERIRVEREQQSLGKAKGRKGKR